MRSLLSGLLLALLVGCGSQNSGEQANNPEGQVNAPARLTAEQAEMILSMKVGQWEIEHLVERDGSNPFPSQEILLGRWKEKGKSVEAVGQDFGKDLLYLFEMIHDQDLGLVVGKITLSNGREMVKHYSWDESTKTIRINMAKPTSLDGKKYSVAVDRLDDDSFTGKVTVTEDGKTIGTQYSRGQRFGPASDKEFEDFKQLFRSEATGVSMEPSQPGLVSEESTRISSDLSDELVAEDEEIPDFPDKKMTAQQARESLARGVGQFQGQGTRGPVNGEQVATRDNWQARLVAGEIAAEIVGRFESENQEILYQGKIYYDEQLGLLVLKYSDSLGLERTEHYYSDLTNGRNYVRSVAPPLPPGVSVSQIRDEGEDGHGNGRIQVTQDGKPVFRMQYAFEKIGPVDDRQFGKMLAEQEQAMKTLNSNKLAFVPYTTREALPRSQGNQDVRIVFQNDLEKVIKYWYVEEEENKLYGEMQPGERRSQQTFTGHVWLITDEDDKPLGYFIASGVDATARIVPVKPAGNPE